MQVMILSHDRERGRVSLSTKKLEPTPGDMIRNPKLVFEKVLYPLYFSYLIVEVFLLKVLPPFLFSCNTSFHLSMDSFPHHHLRVRAPSVTLSTILLWVPT